jgi:hypothetical protein
MESFTSDSFRRIKGRVAIGWPGNVPRKSYIMMECCEEIGIRDVAKHMAMSGGPPTLQHMTITIAAIEALDAMPKYET